MLNGIHRRGLISVAAKATSSVLLSVAGISGGAEPATSSSDGSAWASRLVALQKTIPKLMHESNVPGLSIAIIKGARLVWASNFGVSDRASATRVDRNTVFEAGSMSKPVFAYAVMKLREKGIIDLDTPLMRYTQTAFIEGEPKLNLVTARHVLSHTTGFQNVRSGDNPLKFHFTPGEKWLYSGEGYFYLQSVISTLTGHVNSNECSSFEAGLTVCASDFAAYMQRKLLGPFQMNHSGYLWNDKVRGHIARPHDSFGEPLPYRQPTPAGVERYGAMGGLLTTAGDYAKFLIEVLRPKPQDASRLSRASVDEMLRPYVKVEDGNDYSVFWALGWRVAKTSSGVFVSHGGDQTGFHSTSEICPARSSGYVVLTNGDNGWKLIQHLAPAMSTWVHTARM